MESIDWLVFFVPGTAYGIAAGASGYLIYRNYFPEIKLSGIVSLLEDRAMRIQYWLTPNSVGNQAERFANRYFRNRERQKKTLF